MNDLDSKADRSADIQDQEDVNFVTKGLECTWNAFLIWAHFSTRDINCSRNSSAHGLRGIAKSFGS